MQTLYLPILEELGLPYMMIYDMFPMCAFIPKGLDAPTFKRLYWSVREKPGYHLLAEPPISSNSVCKTHWGRCLPVSHAWAYIL